MHIARKAFLVGGLLAWAAIIAAPAKTRAAGASLYVSPASGSFTVGSTFTVSIYVDSGGEAINAVEADMSFDPTVLQVVSPSSGKSFFQTWVAQPAYSNTAGTLNFAGAIPNPGIVTNAGLVSTVTFRVMSEGTTALKFTDASQVLLNDGKGTDILGSTSDGIYTLAAAPPAGPIVTSPTNPDQNSWYDSSQVVLQWTPVPGATGYAYTISDNPIDTPNDIVNGTGTSVDYSNLADGVHYFHIMALKGGVWGGATNFAVRVDQAPPAAFSIDISPGSYTTNQDPVIRFGTTDPVSGIDHYEVKIIPLDPQGSMAPAMSQSFFTEATSPYIEHFPLGRFTVVVRAFNRAGNYTQETANLSIVPPLLEVVGPAGILVGQSFTLGWPWVFLFVILLVAVLSFWLAKAIARHSDIEARLAKGAASNPEIASKLAELREKRKEYEDALKRLGVIVISAASILGILGFGVHGTRSALAAAGADASGTGLTLNPPIINLYPASLANDEVLYIGGWANVPDATVEVYIEQTATGNMYSGTAFTGSDGNWFYSSSELLPAGDYAAWAELVSGSTKSPPSGRVDVAISETAIQIGNARLDYAELYLMLFLVALSIAAILLVLVIVYGRRTRKKRFALEESIRIAEESLRRGFTLLQRDIEAEIAGIQNLKLKGAMSEAEQARESKLLRDLDAVKRYIGKEIWHIEEEDGK